MKRDSNLIRRILLAMEDAEELPHGVNWDGFGCSDTALAYHLGLLYRHGLIEGIEAGLSGQVMPTGITWEGHEFLDNVRNENIWRTTLDTIGVQAGTASLAILVEVAKSEVKRRLNLP